MFRNVARCLDAIFVIAGALLATWARYPASPFELADNEKLLIAFNCVLVLLLFPTFGIYEAWRGKPLVAMLGRVAMAWLVAASIGLLLVFTLHRSDSLSRLWYGTATVASALLIVATKCAAHLMLRSARRRGLNYRTVAIVGAPGFARMLIAHLERAPQAGLKPVLVLDTGTDAMETTSMRLRHLPVMHDIDAFVDEVRNGHINEVWLALPLSEEHTIYRFTQAFRHDFVSLRLVPDVRSIALFDRATVEIVGLPTISLTGPTFSSLQMWPKLIFDRLFALVALIALAPVFVLLAAAIKLSSPGPVFFTQMRKGVDGRPFRIYKFRSMALHRETPGQVTQAKRHDARVTKLGAFMRKTSLDELPQFINVLLGQMSVVGPRPHAIEHDDFYKDVVYGYMHRYRIKPGITGWAQVNGYRGATTKVEKMETRVKFDLFYIHNWSFWFDIRIVFLTIFKGFVGRNAF